MIIGIRHLLVICLVNGGIPDMGCSAAAAHLGAFCEPNVLLGCYPSTMQDNGGARVPRAALFRVSAPACQSACSWHCCVPCQGLSSAPCCARRMLWSTITCPPTSAMQALRPRSSGGSSLVGSSTAQLVRIQTVIKGLEGFFTHALNTVFSLRSHSMQAAAYSLASS